MTEQTKLETSVFKKEITASNIITALACAGLLALWFIGDSHRVDNLEKDVVSIRGDIKQLGGEIKDEMDDIKEDIGDLKDDLQHDLDQFKQDLRYIDRKKDDE